MIVPSTAALLALACLCFDSGYCAAGDGHQRPLKSSKEKAKIMAACPAYEHYARFPQYVHFVSIIVE